MHDNLILMVEF